MQVEIPPEKKAFPTWMEMLDEISQLAQLKVSPFIRYNGQSRKGDYLCSKVITVVN